LITNEADACSPTPFSGCFQIISDSFSVFYVSVTHSGLANGHPLPMESSGAVKDIVWKNP